MMYCTLYIWSVRSDESDGAWALHIVRFFLAIAVPCRGLMAAGLSTRSHMNMSMRHITDWSMVACYVRCGTDLSGSIHCGP